MTTSVRIDAHAGWPVRVTAEDKPFDGDWVRIETATVIPAGEVRTVYITQTRRLIIEELRRDENGG